MFVCSQANLKRVFLTRFRIFDPPQDNAIQKFSRHPTSNMGKRVKDQTFGFDRVFDDNCTQDDVYAATTRPLLDSVLDGYNATVFAYGATGCGKTHTITGTSASPGIIFLTMQELFDKIAERSDEKSTEVSLSYMEIYNETIRDLLVPGGSTQGLMLREDANQAVSVAGLSTHHPKDVQQVMEMVVNGNAYRTVSPTEANATSSRSHAVLQINVAQKDRNADINEPHTMATLSIIDLAGSERASATKNRGARLMEGANINKSLLALGSCINALCDPRKKNHVPYRNSKLTRLLKFSLGGNCKTVMIVCVSPSSAHFDETQNTLRYANRAKNIQTKVTRNVYNVNRHVKDFLIKIDEQMALINELKAQQKDYEGIAFAKFKKQSDKRDQIAREGVVRLRAAYDISQAERQEKANSMKKLRQIENRISLLSAWIAGFDNVCESREDADMPKNLTATRKTAQGILLELENSRQHFHQRIDKNNWERAMDSALANSVKQLMEADATEDGCDIASLTREAEFLRANAAREAFRDILDMEKGNDAALMQALLAAHFDAISSVNDILTMTEEDAVHHAKRSLTKLFNASSIAACQVVKPDGSLTVTQVFPPTKRGTPKRKKAVNPTSFGTEETMAPPVMAPLEAPQFTSPMKASPRRRKAPVGKKGLSYTPKKKSPSKRSVRWRDDTESGSLAEFEKTPQKILSTPEQANPSPEESVVLPAIPAYLASEIHDDADEDSSPMPTAPEPTLDIRPKSNRFQAGFLSKKSSAGSTPPSTLTSLMNTNSSDTDKSPLRSIDPSKASNRSSLQAKELKSEIDTLTESGNSSSAEGENSVLVDKFESAKIGSALKRASSGSGNRRVSHAHGASDSNQRTQRRRSPNAAGSSLSASRAAGSPPNENAMFTASHARRMVNSQKEGGFRTDVLSPRTAPITKGGVIGQRRTTIGHEGRGGSSGAANAAVRLNGSGTVGSTPKQRESVMGVMGKGGWR